MSTAIKGICCGRFTAFARMGFCWTVLIALLIASLVGCGAGGSSEVVVYTALDQDFSAPIFREFTSETGFTVLPKYDTESTKTVGLVTTIMSESNRPRCDLFWNNEILNTIRLERQGLLRPFKSPAAAGYPEDVQSPNEAKVR